MNTEKAATAKIANLIKKKITKITTTKKQVKIIVRDSLLDHLSKDLPKAISGSGFFKHEVSTEVMDKLSRPGTWSLQATLLGSS